MRGLTITKERNNASVNLDPKTKKVMTNLKVKMAPEQIFALKFMGVPVNNREIFKSIDSFSPTAKPKKMSTTPLNLIKFEKFLSSAYRYVEKAKEKGNSSQDFYLKTNMNHLVSKKLE